MQYLVLDVLQDDCPLTRTTREHDVTFCTPYWQFTEASGRWDLRVHVDAADEDELESTLRTLRSDASMRQFQLRAKTGSTAFLRLVFDETAAIGTVSTHGGYVVGPFYNTGGCERWHLGFDTDRDASNALSDLDRHEKFEIRERCRVETPLEFDPFRYYETANSLLDSCRQLTRRERTVLETAIEMGYYETPREATLKSVGDCVGVSDVAVSKTLRRAERKLLTSGLSAAETIHSS